MLFGLGNTAERLRNEVAFEGVQFRGVGGRLASSDGESVDEFENEESREGAAEVADAVQEISKSSVSINRKFEGRT